MPNQVIPDLYYYRDGRYRTLPPWASFFIELGRFAGNAPREQKRLVLSAAMPTSAFAAAFTAAGVTTARASMSLPLDPYQYAEDLSKLPLGTGVWLRGINDREDKKIRGQLYWERETLSGPNVPGKGLSLRVLIQRYNHHAAGGTTYIIEPKDACRITPADFSDANLPVGINENQWQLLTSDSRFLQEALGTADALEFVFRTSLECVLLGPIGKNQDELMNTIMAAGTPEKTGILQDLVRANRCLKSHDSYRTQMYAGNSPNLPEEIRLKPQVVVFDGASGYLRWRHHFSKSHWIVLLDRTEPNFTDAVSELNRDIQQVPVQERRVNLGFAVPQGLEIMGYQKQVKE